eukprot:3008896-Prymnesium_polylepis.1
MRRASARLMRLNPQAYLDRLDQRVEKYIACILLEVPAPRCAPPPLAPAAQAAAAVPITPPRREDRARVCVSQHTN